MSEYSAKVLELLDKEDLDLADLFSAKEQILEVDLGSTMSDLVDSTIPKEQSSEYYRGGQQAMVSCAAGILEAINQHNSLADFRYQMLVYAAILMYLSTELVPYITEE